MAAIVRVKRHLDEEPSDALILNCKKRKIELENPDVSTALSRAVLKFAGTVQEDKDILAQLHRPNKSDLDLLKDTFKKHEVNITEKLRQESKASSKNNRFKIVNLFRSPKPNIDTEKSGEISESKITILEVESESCKDSQTKERTETPETKYVYDLYYTHSDDLGDVEIEDYVSVQPLSDTLIFGSLRDNGVNDVDSDDSEDSNAENNWRNDYPDESDMESINEDDMIQAMEKVDLDDDLLSSDDGEEGFVYSIDSEAVGFEEGIDESDVHRYGERYARFKARHKNVVTSQLDNDFTLGDIDEDENYY